jgi:hypothetical protein
MLTLSVLIGFALLVWLELLNGMLEIIKSMKTDTTKTKVLLTIVAILAATAGFFLGLITGVFK